MGYYQLVIVAIGIASLAITIFKGYPYYAIFPFGGILMCCFVIQQAETISGDWKAYFLEICVTPVLAYTTIIHPVIILFKRNTHSKSKTS